MHEVEGLKFKKKEKEKGKKKTALFCKSHLGKKEGGREREKCALSFVSSLPKCSPKSQAGLDLTSRTKNSVLVYCAREGGGRENGQRPNYLIYNLVPSRLCISKKLGNFPNECEF